MSLMYKVDRWKIFIKGFKLSKIYQCSNCEIWSTEKENICPNCDDNNTLKGENLRSANLVKKKSGNYFSV